MRNAFLDVRLELNEAALSAEDDPTAFIVEKSRHEADRLCEQSGAKLHTDSAPEFLIEKGDHRLTGERCVLVASRWKVTVPENTTFGPPEVAT